MTKIVQISVLFFLISGFFFAAPVLGNNNSEIVAPLINERFVTEEEIVFEFAPDNNASGEDVCWNSDLDGELGCGETITQSGLSLGTHQITAEVDGNSETVTIRLFSDLWELYQAEPSQAEIDRILSDFNFEWVDSDDETWDDAEFTFFDDDPTAMSKLTFIARLDILRKQQFSEIPVFIGDYETVYDWAKGTIHTIEFRLDCGNAFGGGGKVSFPRHFSHWGPTGRESDCGVPRDDFYLNSYLIGLPLFVHEVRHSEPDDPGHIEFQRRIGSVRNGDAFLEGGSGYAWAAKYSMWVYKYSLYDPEAIRHGYVNENVLENARNTAVSQLETIYGANEPAHSNPLVQAFLDEVRAPQLEAPDDNLEDVPTILELSWEEVSSANSYALQIYKENQLGPDIWETPTNPFYKTSIDELEPYTSYYWQVLYRDDFGRSLWSDIWKFTTGEISDPFEEFKPFVTVWQTDNFGETNDNQISIPIIPGLKYNISVDWGDDSVTNWQDGDSIDELTHSYSEPGTYTVSIVGDLPSISFVNHGDREKIIDVKQWGEIEWVTLQSAFNGCSNLNISAEDAPDLSSAENVMSLNRTFRNAASLTAEIGHWDTSNISNVVQTFMYASAFNSDISGWNTENFSHMNNMLNGASSFDQNLGGWNLSSVETMSGMLDHSGLSKNNYDATLDGWAQFVENNNGPQGISLGAEGLQFCQAAAARQSLIDNFEWQISGDTEACEPSLGAPELVSPTDGTHTSDEELTFVWNAVDQASSYKMNLALDEEFEEMVISSSEIEETEFQYDEPEPGTTYFWRVRAVADDTESPWSATWSFSTGEFTSVDDSLAIPTQFSLSQNYPNPFNPITTIQYQIARPGDVRIQVYDIHGRRIQTLVDSNQETGVYTIQFDGSSLASGVYLLRMEAGDFMSVQKITLLK